MSPRRKFIGEQYYNIIKLEITKNIKYILCQHYMVKFKLIAAAYSVELEKIKN